MPQFIIGIIIIAVIFQALAALFEWMGKIMSTLFQALGWFFYTMAAAIDRLFGQWGTSPTVSWAITGLVLGSTCYFVTKESRKLSRPALGPMLVTSCGALLAIAPYLGPKTATRPAFSMPEPVNHYAGTWHGAIGSKKATFNISQNGEALNGNVIYDNVNESLEGSCNGNKITLRGTGWTAMNRKKKSFSLDTFTGELSGGNTFISGQYQDRARHSGKWHATKSVTGAQTNVVNNFVPAEPAKPAEPPKTTESTSEEIIAVLLGHPQKKNSDKEFRYGQMLLNGNGISKNTDKGITLLKQSAQHGSTKAQKLLGGLYYKGNAVAQNYSEAAGYYKMAAEGGATDAQHFYGMMLAKGIGTEQDIAAGTAWIRKAADKGHSDAKKVLEQIESKR